jgi:hypothetical protein
MHEPAFVFEDGLFCAAFERGSEPADLIATRYQKVHTALGAFLARSKALAWVGSAVACPPQGEPA